MTDSLGKNIYAVNTKAGAWKRHADQTIPIDNKKKGVRGTTEGDPIDSNPVFSPSEEHLNVASPVTNNSPVRTRPTRDKKKPDRYTSVDFRK